jgi:hypothetical protein
MPRGRKYIVEPRKLFTYVCDWCVFLPKGSFPFPLKWRGFHYVFLCVFFLNLSFT